MRTYCKFHQCSWSGDVTALFKHCDSEHNHFVKDINEENFFELEFKDITKDTFLLCGNEGLYWFLMDRKQHIDHIRHGIFAIDDSEICEYTTMIGQQGAEHFMVLQGPYETLPIKSKKFEIELSYRSIMYYDQMSLNCMRIVFSEPDKSRTHAETRQNQNNSSDEDDSDSEDEDSDDDDEDKDEE